jgi:hypothetical protein
MKKKSKIRIIKDKINSDSYTFLTESGPPYTLQLSMNPDEIEIDEKPGTENLVDIYKKKKVLTNEDMAKSSKGLKFSNPSQRNHSSIYE